MKKSENPLFPSQLRPFTLVELLVVVAIMALLIFVALPAFEKIAKGQGAELAARNIAAKLGTARSYAISNRVYVAVLIPQVVGPNPTPSTGTTAIPADYVARSYRLCVVKNNSGTYEFVRWIPGESWEFTPTGTAVLEIDSSAIPVSGTDINAANLNDGGLGAGCLVNNVNCSDVQSAASDVDNFAAIIFKATGRPCNTNGHQVKIGEGVYSGGAMVLTNKKANSYIQITVDQYTGRVSYGNQ